MVPTEVVSTQEWNARGKGAPGQGEGTHTRARCPRRRTAPHATVFVSAGSQEAIDAYRTRMGWSDWPWYTTPTRDDFSADFDVEELSSIWALLDITRFGQHEQWQNTPEGVPQGLAGSWVRRSDEYTTDELAARRTD